ncbi:hypothetical protein BT93_L0412 [Corymbia citriodora subsp. variegata]|uniref:Uncharacterized protein n=1 Tax=Corymbia citriodora subsp. variegata TaxID=360336 RepID=A0A8T0CUJ9_CORYI|nr:hypothetical protein BT93_L0412 [Corymbia citriodora subsp. variegata]
MAIPLAQAQSSLQVRHYVAHRRPVLPFQVHAVHRRVRHQLHRLRLLHLRRRHPAVQHPRHLPGRYRRQGVVHHAHRRRPLPLPVLEDGLLPRQQLQQHHPEPVHVALRREHVQPVVLRVDVPDGPGRLHQPLVAVRLVLLLRVMMMMIHQRQAEVGDPSGPIRVEQYVRRFDVSVNDWRDCVAVQILDASRRVERDLDPHLPRIQDAARYLHVVLVVQVIVESSIFHVLVDQQPLVLLHAVPN